MCEKTEEAIEEGEVAVEDSSDLFVIDSSPAVVKDDLGVPTYDKKFSDVLQVEEGDKEKPSKRKPPQNSCWNCLGSHNLTDCPERRNPEAINRNRQIFLSKQGPRTKQSRYHLDDDQKYPHVRPGRISTKLRRALGLRSHQLPRHIYRMRALGYPPGWVEEARVSHSGLVLFDSQGQEVADPGFEDGEIAPEGAKDKYDIRKIIEYPGFNCQCSSDTVDESERLNAPPMSELQTIERMISIWQPQAVRSYKRKRMSAGNAGGGNSTPGTASKTRSLLLLDDMDVEESEGSEEEEGEVKQSTDDGSEIPPSLPEDAKLPSSSTPPSDRKRSLSPSEDPLETKKQKLQVELDVKQSEMLSEGDVSFRENEQDDESSEVSKEGLRSSACNTPEVGHVKSIVLGTPVIVTSKYTSLPTPEKFAKDICDVINFENLPDATGKYEKMSGLIKKVRSCVSQINQEGSDSE